MFGEICFSMLVCRSVPVEKTHVPSPRPAIAGTIHPLASKPTMRRHIKDQDMLHGITLEDVVYIHHECFYGAMAYLHAYYTHMLTYLYTHMHTRPLPLSLSLPPLLSLSHCLPPLPPFLPLSLLSLTTVNSSLRALVKVMMMLNSSMLVGLSTADRW